MEEQNKIHSSIKDLISKIRDGFPPLTNILVRKFEDYQEITQLNIKKINQILTNMENNPQSIIANNIANIKTILKSCDDTLLNYSIDSQIELNNISIKLKEISSEYLTLIKKNSNNKNLAVEMESLQKELNDNKNKYNSLKHNYLKLQEKIKEMQSINKNDSRLEKVIKKRNKTVNNIRYSKISKLLSEKNAHCTELQIEILEKIKEINKLKQNILKINQIKSRNNDELEYQKYSTKEKTITSDNKIELNVEIENQLLKERIKTLESEIEILQNKNNSNDGLKEMGKKQMELLQQLDKYKCKNEQLKNQLKKNQNEYLLNQIKEIEEKYKKEIEVNKKIFEEDMHEKIIEINDLKLEIIDLKKVLTNNGKNDVNIVGNRELRNDKKEIPQLKCQNQELEN